MRQSPLFGDVPAVDMSQPPVHHVHQATSREAWRSVQAHLGPMDARIVATIHARGMATADAIEVVTGLKHQTVSAQITHLRDAGVIVDSGTKGRTRSGRAAIQWQLVPR